MLAPWKKSYDQHRQHNNKGISSQSYNFSSSHVWMWELDYKESTCWRIDAFELCCWSRCLRVPWTARKTNQSILKEISPEYSLKGLMLKLKLQYLATWWDELTHWERPSCWERLKVGGKGTTEDEMVGWHHELNGHEFEQTLGVGDGQGCLSCCSSWSLKESDWTEWLNWTELNWWKFHYLPLWFSSEL